MSSQPKRPVTLGAKLGTAWIYANSIPRAVFWSVFGSAIYKKYSWPFRRIFATRFIQIASPRISFKPYALDIEPTTGDTVRSNCTKNNWPLTSHLLPGENCADSTLHQIHLPTQPSPHTPVLVYFHGGGYRNPASKAAHPKMAYSYASALGASSAFFLEYTLTPFGQYPSQLRQAVIALRYVLVELKIKPEQIVLAGDSAGGNLVLALLAHLIQPHPNIKAIKEMDGKKLKGAYGLSPWATLDYDTESVQKWNYTDMLTKDKIQHFTEFWAPKEGEVWADVSSGSRSFWSKVPVERILLTVGGFEIFQDGVTKMAELLEGAQEEGVQVTFVKGPGEVHVQVALDLGTNCPQSQSTTYALKWFNEFGERSTADL